MAGLLLNWSQELPDGLEWRVWENGELIIDHLASTTFSVDMQGRPDATYEYYVTSVRIADGLESAPGPTVSIVFMNPPAAPTGLTVSLVK